MNCLGRLTNAIKVETISKKGSIYFEDGNIIHAEVDDLDGEDAFYEILTWQGGSFSINRSAKAEQETILKGWQSLMLEGLRRADEIREKEVASEESKEARTKQIQSLLKKFIATKGIHMLTVFDANLTPFVVELNNELKDKYKIDEISAKLEKLLKQERSMATMLGLEERKELSFEYAEGLLKLTWLPDNKGFLLLLADQSSNFGLLRIETKKYLKSLVNALN